MTANVDRASMAEMIRQIDPDGTLAATARRVGDILAPHIQGIAQTAADAFFASAPAHCPTHGFDRATIRRQLAEIYGNQFLHLNDDGWSESFRTFLRESLSIGYPARSQLIVLGKATDRMRDIIAEAETDFAAFAELVACLRNLMLVQAEIICSEESALIRAEDSKERARQQEVFAGILSNQIDGTAELGIRLRDQAREASSATRGMLDKASEVAAAAEQSAIAMREAAHTSSGLIRAIEEARSEVDDAADVAARASKQAGEAVEMSAALSDHAKSIESILGLIRDIAGQTNLLALNATIEAARAGDAGRGFAVVAQEVKTLASQTARATDDIAQKIAAIQNATRQSVETNERIRATVQDVHAMNIRIRSAMDAQSQTVTMITAAVDETALAADSMSSNISAIRQDTEIVASEIDALEQGFNEVQTRLDRLRTESEDVVHRAPEARAASAR